MDPVDVVRRLGGVAASGEIIGVSTRAQLRTAVKQGRLVRLRHDTYALGDLDSARAEAVAAGGVLSHLSAAQWWGWKVKFPPPRTHVTVPANRRRPAGNLAVHFAHLAEKEIHRDVTDQARTVIDCARMLPFDEALAVADSALRSGDIDRTDLENALSGCPRAPGVGAQSGSWSALTPGRTTRSSRCCERSPPTSRGWRSSHRARSRAWDGSTCSIADAAS